MSPPSASYPNDHSNSDVEGGASRLVVHRKRNDGPKAGGPPPSSSSSSLTLSAGKRWLTFVVPSILFIVVALTVGMPNSTSGSSSITKLSTARSHDSNSSSNNNKNNLQKEREELFAELSKKTPLPLPLRPPFRIVQDGRVRTGSTFQMHLLDAIAQLKSKGTPYTVEFEGYQTRRTKISEIYQDFHGESWITKSHSKKDDALEDLQKQGELVVFTSGMILGEHAPARYTLYNQDKDDLIECSLCQVDNYRHIFDLSDEDIRTIKEYLAAYEKIRRCCGKQMSQYEKMRLHGCDMTPMLDDPLYPHCEDVDKQQAEIDLLSSSVPHRVNSVQSNWSQKGDCERFDNEIKAEPFDMKEECPK